MLTYLHNVMRAWYWVGTSKLERRRVTMAGMHPSSAIVTCSSLARVDARAWLCLVLGAKCLWKSAFFEVVDSFSRSKMCSPTK